MCVYNVIYAQMFVSTREGIGITSVYSKLDEQVIKSIIDTYHDDEHQEYRDELVLIEHYMGDDEASTEFFISLAKISGLRAPEIEGCLGRHKSENRHRFDILLDEIDDGLLQIFIGRIKKDKDFHEKYISIYDECDKLVQKGKGSMPEILIVKELSQEIVDKCEKTLQCIPQDIMDELDTYELYCDSYYVMLASDCVVKSH